MTTQQGPEWLGPEPPTPLGPLLLALTMGEGGSDQASVCGGELPPQPEGDREPPPPSTTSCVPAARPGCMGAWTQEQLGAAKLE